MTCLPITLTPQQQRIAESPSSLFVAACPGSGKTRVLVERVRRLLAGRSCSRGIAILSFTNAAVSELEERLNEHQLLRAPAFPHFVGTFDGFLWQFLVAPFGVPGCSDRPRLIPDKDDYEFGPYRGARKARLGCFDRVTGCAIEERVSRLGLRTNLGSYEAAARCVRANLLGRGEVDFEDVREIAVGRLCDNDQAASLKCALKARFGELIVDEAQDCNPTDLQIIDWFRGQGIPTKVICDPHQAIYSFRGGVTQELSAFGNTFQTAERMSITGNFRSSSSITKAVSALRWSENVPHVDDALGKYREEPECVHILSYSGASVPSTIGALYTRLVQSLSLEPQRCPIVAATREAAERALGRSASTSDSAELSVRLAEAVVSYFGAVDVTGRLRGAEALHAVILELQGCLLDRTYHQYIVAEEVVPGTWRPSVIQLLQELRFDASRSDIEHWLVNARRRLACYLADDRATISQRLRNTARLRSVMLNAVSGIHPTNTIHSVKGRQFPAVCVVMTPPKTKGILDYLTDGAPTTYAEQARKIFVAASRAERLLAIAIPRSQSQRLEDLLASRDVPIRAHRL